MSSGLSFEMQSIWVEPGTSGRQISEIWRLAVVFPLGIGRNCTAIYSSDFKSKNQLSLLSSYFELQEI